MLSAPFRCDGPRAPSIAWSSIPRGECTRCTALGDNIAVTIGDRAPGQLYDDLFFTGEATAHVLRQQPWREVKADEEQFFYIIVRPQIIIYGRTGSLIVKAYRRWRGDIPRDDAKSALTGAHRRK